MSVLARLLFQNPDDPSLLFTFSDIVLSLVTAPYALFLRPRTNCITLHLVVHIIWDSDCVALLCLRIWNLTY